MKKTEQTAPLQGKRNIPIREAQVRLGIGNTKFYELMRAGGIPTVQIGRRRFVKSDVLDRLLDDPAALSAERAA